MELLILIDACKLSGADKITAIIPHFPYARSDKKDAPRVSIASALVTRLLHNAGVDRIVALDLHAGQIQGFVNIPFDNLYAKNLFVNHLKNDHFKYVKNDFVIASPDAGGIKRAEAYAKQLELPFIILHKQRRL